jgi:hypothetical protein
LRDIHERMDTSAIHGKDAIEISHCNSCGILTTR